MKQTRMRTWFLGSAAVLAGFGCGDQAQDSPADPLVVAMVPDGSRFAAASNGDGFLVVYEATTERGGSDVVGVRVSSQGRLLDAAPFPISGASTGSLFDPTRAFYSSPTVAAGDSGYGVTYIGLAEDGAAGEIAFVPVSTEGEATAPPTLVTSSFVFAPMGIAGRDSGFTVVYSREHRFVPPRPDIGLGDFAFRNPEVALVRVEQNRVTVDPPENLVPEVGLSDVGVVSTVMPSVASGAQDTLVAWIDRRFTFSDQAMDTSLQGAWIAAQAPAERTRLATVSPIVGSTKTAASPDDFLVVWTAAPPDSSSINEIHGVLARREGNAVGPDFIVARGATVKELGGVAFADGRYLVAWSEARAVTAAHVDPDGSVDAPFVVEAGPAAAETALASDGTRVLVLFARPTTDETSSLRGVFVD